MKNKNAKIFNAISLSCLFFFCIVLFGCKEESPRPIPDIPTKISAGVALYGCTSGVLSAENPAKIVNINEYPLTVRLVIQTNFGEITKSIDRLGPGGDIILAKINYRHGFYFTNDNGVTVGFFTGECPQ